MSPEGATFAIGVVLGLSGLVVLSHATSKFPAGPLAESPHSHGWRAALQQRPAQTLTGMSLLLAGAATIVVSAFIFALKVAALGPLTDL
ncbi:MAG: hypothetical protein ACK5O2_05010 [Microthrixaceae bacterium]